MGYLRAVTGGNGLLSRGGGLVMVSFVVRREVRVPRGLLLSIIRRIEDYPKYWHGHREVRIIDSSGDMFHVQVKFAFNGPLNHGEAYVRLTDDGVVFNFVKGPFKGIHRVRVGDGELVSEWDIKLHPLITPIRGWVINHFREGAEHALDRIVKEAEAHLSGA